jgi:3-hydroxyisobutyrate dehydrogenase
VESEDGIVNNIQKDQIWIEMSTTNEDQLKRHASLIESKNAIALEAPVSGGCHRAATGNISIFVGGSRKGFERALPILKCLGRRILHTGDFGTASILKVITNYLATVHLVALGEAWTIASKFNLDLDKTFKGIAASSGNSFVHETESQVILNGSYNINFTMDLVEKDVGLFQSLATKLGIDLEISPLVLEIIKDAKEKFGSRAWSSMVVKRLEDKFNTDFRAPGYPEELVDKEKKQTGYEI